MEVLFLILKIIGIAFLVLLGILLFLILSIIFIPVRYSISGKGNIPGKVKVNIIVSWFLHLFHGRICYDEKGLQFRVRICGIPIHLGKNEDNKKTRKNKKTKKIKKQDNVEKQPNTAKTKQQKALEEAAKPEKTDNPEETVEQENSKVPDTPAGTESSKTPRGWVSRKIHELKQKFYDIKRKLKNLKQKISQIKEQSGDIKNMLFDETNKRCIVLFWKEFKYLMKHFSPRKASGELQFGMEDPSNTGQLLGVASLFPFWYHYKISIIPDFMAENTYAEGNLSVKGHIRCIHMLTVGIRFIKNKDIRRLFEKIMR